MSAVLDWPGEAELETGDCRIGSFSIDVFTAVGVVVPFIGLFLSSETHLVVKAEVNGQIYGAITLISLFSSPVSFNQGNI